jgi:iron complex transport system ATP-binding protein
VIEAQGIGVRRGGAWLLRDVACAVEAGRVLAIVGPNGAGKSTLLAVLSGALRPDEGGVRLDGVPIDTRPPRTLARRRAVMSQQARSAFAFSVRQVAGLGRLPWGGPDEPAVQRALLDAGVAHLAARLLPGLSGGEAARAQFARALVQLAPALPGAALLLDEPTAALDAAHRGQLLRRVRALAGQGAAIALVLHDLNEARFVADQVLLLSVGQVAAHGTPDRVLTDAVLAPVYGTRFRVGADWILPDLRGQPGTLGNGAATAA